MAQDSLRVDGGQLWNSLMAMSEVGATPAGGSCRLALSDEDKAGRDLFVAWCETAGCAVTVDDMGNIFARRAGRRDDLPPVVAGSHLDTQPHGGKFDGVYGVLAGLEVIRTLNDHDVATEAPIEVAVWTNEEGSRFAPAMVSSGVFAGLFERDYALGRQDADGKTIGEELARIGYLGTESPAARARSGPSSRPISSRARSWSARDETIGVVVGGQGQRWYDVTVEGQDSHAGSTPLAWPSRCPGCRVGHDRRRAPGGRVPIRHTLWARWASSRSAPIPGTRSRAVVRFYGRYAPPGRRHPGPHGRGLPRGRWRCRPRRVRGPDDRPDLAQPAGRV